MIILDNDIKGNILDIGGGGEGIISSIYGKRVTAIDNSQEEIAEMPESQSDKLLMDASDMLFANGTFDNITAFYSFMYILKSDHAKVLDECYRVLKKYGQLYIWDMEIKSTNPTLCTTDLDIDACGQQIHTSYGIYKPNPAQSYEYFLKLCTKHGFKLLSGKKDGIHFQQQWLRV